ncbi:hypothetical protein [uncultured Faecalibaculum sp.]|uniref:hypothetical protein n=1 Tax=uncultured Faecalibaculum sp. TaxID=1729681 RepID=UPI00272EDA91|nr:hypothetical protein [uncultured Faecalibaculum sp.]
MGTGHAVRVIRTDTGEFWPTISEAATKMNVSIGRLSKARAADLSEVAGIPIRFEETNSNWNALEVQDLETGIVYPSATKCAWALDVTMSTVYHAMMHGCRVKGHRIVYTDAERRKRCPPIKDRRLKMVLCVETGKVYESLTAAAKEMKVSSSCMSNHIRNGSKIKGLTFRFVD